MANPDDERRGNIREHLANERTLLSWVRLSLAIVALGFVVARFGLFIAELFALRSTGSIETRWSVPVGMVLVLSGPVFAVLALLRFRAFEHEIEIGHVRTHHGLIDAIIIATVFISVALAIYLVAVATTISH